MFPKVISCAVDMFLLGVKQDGAHGLNSRIVRLYAAQTVCTPYGTIERVCLPNGIFMWVWFR